ncbi:MAG: hypothetical protein JG776_1448 [Caloramator sp.]|jgi:hypothetical protein|uniref:hypothetical protein n=1 Tax=Caloramator sp. TaxID=1871330 RepID=UPI001D4A8D55|nr:hypothetical protein [Caloramator sp.]MBZ4663733.1 hypothetical protein [Caloramator sp.]
MDSKSYNRILNLIKDKENPAALNAAGVLLIFYEYFEEAYAIFNYNFDANGDEVAKKILKEFWLIKEYIKDFNRALELANKKDYRYAQKILEFYYNKGFMTISGFKLFMVCLFKRRRFKEFRRVNEEIKSLGFDIDFDKYIQHLNFKIKSILFTSLIIPSVLVGAYIVKSNSKTEVVYRDLPQEKQIVYKYIEDDSSKRLKDVLGSQLESSLYKNGLKVYKNRRYDEAYNYFKLAYEFTSNSYIKQHTLFLLAKVSKDLKRDDAVVYYKEYVREFKYGCYYDEALYDLALLLYEKGQVEAKEYANMIDTRSIFFNNKIKRIIGGGI